jgi:hypothetical protein
MAARWFSNEGVVASSPPGVAARALRGPQALDERTARRLIAHRAKHLHGLQIGVEFLLAGEHAHDDQVDDEIDHAEPGDDGAERGERARDRVLDDIAPHGSRGQIALAPFRPSR